MMKINSLRHAYPEPCGFFVDRKKGHKSYTFLHFFNSVEIVLGGEKIKTHPHAFIIYDIGTPQYFRSETPLLHDWIHFDGNISAMLVSSGIELNRIYYPSSHQFITELTREMETEFYTSKPNGERLIELKLNELFIKLGRAVSDEKTAVADFKIQEKLRYLRGEMFSRLGEKWSVSRMAEEIGYSQSRFYNLYKSYYGISPTADIIVARINAAKNMLSFGKKTVSEIAEILGYENTTHFIRQFKSYTGIPPTAYRKKN